VFSVTLSVTVFRDAPQVLLSVTPPRSRRAKGTGGGRQLTAQ